MGQSGLLHVGDVVSESSKLHDNRAREVLVGEQARHPLRRLVILNGLIDLFTM